MVKPDRSIATAMQRAALAFCLHGLIGCALFGGSESRRATPQSASASARGLSLAQLSAQWTSLEALPSAREKYDSSLAYVVHGKASIDHVLNQFLHWCRDNGGRLESRPKAAECPDLAQPVSGCLGEASWWFMHETELAVLDAACVTPDGVMFGALLDTASQAAPDAGSDEIALYEGADLRSFLEKYMGLSKNAERKSAERAAAAREEAYAAFAKKVAELDAATAPGNAKLATARESIQFIVEMMRRGFGYTRQSEFVQGPCTFRTSSDKQIGPLDVNLAKLDLNALERVTERKEERIKGHADSVGDIISVYQLRITDGDYVGHAEFLDIDTAERTARAFTALGQRCGAKLDTRFR